MRKGTRKVFAVFAKTLYLRDINSCIASAASSVDTKREMSYIQALLSEKISYLPKRSWDEFHLQQPDP